MLTLNHRSFHKMRAAFTLGLAICGASFALVWPNLAFAQFSGEASGFGRFESNSNVFAAPSGGVRVSDQDYAYGADLIGRYQLGRQEVHASFEAEEDGYLRNTQLNHNSYTFDVGLNWKLGSKLDGALDVTRTHTMVPFYDLTGAGVNLQTPPTALSVATTQTETANIGYLFYSTWRVTASGSNIKTDQPIPNAPNLELTQNSGATSIEYTSLSGLTSGFQAGYTSGNYNSTTAVALDGTNTPTTTNPSFSQETAGFLTNYKFKRTSFDGQLGYSRRNSSATANETSGVTGLLAFTDQLTPKTSLILQGDRVINSYLLNAGSEIDTDATAGVTWQATYKVSLYGAYTYTYRQFPGQGNNPPGSERIDAQQVANFALTYDPQPWLSIRTYANLTLRNTNFVGGHFEQNVVGITVTVTPYRVKRKPQPIR